MADPKLHLPTMPASKTPPNDAIEGSLSPKKPTPTPTPTIPKTPPTTVHGTPTIPKTPPNDAIEGSLSPKKPISPTLHGTPTIPKTYFDLPKSHYPRWSEIIERTEHRPNHLCRCIVISTCLFLVLLIGAAFGFWCVILKPKAPEYSIEHVSVSGFNVSQSIQEFQIGIRVENPNKIKEIYYYSKGSYVNVYSTNVIICNGVWPRFYQSSDTVTNIKTVLRGEVLSKAFRNGLKKEEEDGEGNVSLRFDLKTPVRFKVGSLKLWKTTVKASCNVTVANLTTSEANNIVATSKGCDVKLELWPF